MGGSASYWAFDDCKAYALPEGRVLVRNPRNGNQAIITPDVFQALTECIEFRTLDEHARRIARLSPGLEGQEAAVREVLDSVRRDGLLISADIYPTLIHPRSQPATLDDRAVAAVITWERPEALERCLESVLDHCELEVIAGFFVIDDSRNADAQARNRAATGRFAERAGTAVNYMGAGEQHQLLQSIIRKAPQAEAGVRFLIDRERWDPYWTSGLARTVALLLSVGRRLLVLDDDILCEVFEPHAHAGRVQFADRGREADFFADASGWEQWRAERDTDPFARHLRLLGLALEDALGALGVGALQATDFANANAAAVEKYRPGSPVLMTECGSLGDPGTSMSNWLTGLDGASLERLLESDETVSRALEIRRCWSGRSIAQVSPHANMSQLTGLDNRYLLPPFIPIMRGEDRLFGSMVEFLHPGSVTLDNAWAVPHLPIPERRWGDADRPFNTSEPFPRFSLSLVDEHLGDVVSRDPIRRLGHMAQLHESLAEMDHAALHRHYMDKRLQAKTRRYIHLKSVRAQADAAPRVWRDYLDEAIARLNRELIDNPVDHPLRGYPEGIENERLAGWWQDFWKQFGHALRAWPAIRQAARDVMAQAARAGD